MIPGLNQGLMSRPNKKRTRSKDWVSGDSFTASVIIAETGHGIEEIQTVANVSDGYPEIKNQLRQKAGH